MDATNQARERLADRLRNRMQENPMMATRDRELMIEAAAALATQPATSPMKVAVDRDWLAAKIAADPDAECDAGVMHPEATQPATSQEGEGVRRDDIRRSIIRQLGDDPYADRIILNGTDWDIVLEALRAPIAATPTPPTPGSEDGTALGEVQCACSEDDGVPDVGVSVGLGNGKALWIGETLLRDGSNIGVVFHGPDQQRIIAPLPDGTDWQLIGDILRHHVAPALQAPDYKTAWQTLSKPLSWMHDNPRLKQYWGWNLADIANDLIDKAYPGMRSGEIVGTVESTEAHNCPACSVEARDLGAVLHNLLGQLQRGVSVLDHRAVRKTADAKASLARWQVIVDAHFAAVKP